MIRHLTTLVLCGVLGSMVLVGNAEACHKKKCGVHAGAFVRRPQPAPCVTPAPVPSRPLRDTNDVCAQDQACCFKLPTFCHKKPACATPVAYCAPAPVYYSYAAPGQLSHRFPPGLGSALIPSTLIIDLA